MKEKNVTRRQLTDALASGLNLPMRSAGEIVDTLFATMKGTLVKGEAIKLVHFGTLSVRDKVARLGRNPHTGEAMTISKRQTVSFKPCKQLREGINKK